MNKTASKLILGALAAATLVAVLAVFFTSVAPEAKAGSVENSVHQPSAKGDRLPLFLSTGAACSVRAWPNYDRACQFDVRTSAKDARTVRIIALR
jgi:hypothetical protein